jgi:CubicO group peptidase (beta-lactamase class C family)
VTALVSESLTPSLPVSALSGLARRHRVPGAQLAIHHGGTTTASEVGELEFSSGRRVSRDAAFPIGSITKCFTATVAMILAADGDVDLDTPVGDYLPELGDLGVAVNLRQLLSHTSGLADISGTQEPSALTLRRYVVDHARSKDPVLPPGTGFSYSNPGYVLVGWLIETVTGMSWAEAVESILLQPLGIEPAFVNLPGTRPSRRPFATGHSANIATGRTQPVRQSVVPVIAPAGALAMSAVDLVKLGLIHIGPEESRLLTTDYAAQMRQAVPCADPFGLADGWGLGLAVFRQQTAAWVGHEGNADGISCHLRINPADGWVIALTSNANTGDGLWHDLLAELSQAGVPIEPPAAPAADGRRVVPPPGCAGWYANGDVEYAITAVGNGAVHMSIDGENFVPLTFHDGFTFSLVAPDSGRRVFGGQFVREPSTGKVYGIQVGGRLARKQIFI